jgi:general secretion pathway protein G
MGRKELMRQAAFTLVELMVVIVIIGILAGIVLPNYLGRIQPAQEARIKADFRSITDAIRSFKMDMNTYPQSLEELTTAASASASADSGTVTWRGPYLENPPKDPWGREYIYELNEGSTPPFILKSYGADGTEGGEGEKKDYSSVDDLTQTRK